ncbi:MAG: hypothetical protein HY289_06640 [Planctomycetes bacterium]|nr:hypothetical protein [Planctomycetota bacterium]
MKRLFVMLAVASALIGTIVGCTPSVDTKPGTGGVMKTSDVQKLDTPPAPPPPPKK